MPSFRLFWRGVLLTLTAGTLALSLMAVPPAAAEGLGWDKANHAVAMLLLTVIAYLAARPARRAVVFAACYTLTLGVLIELLQGACTATRTAEWGDLAADIAGIVIAAAAIVLWRLWKGRER